MSNGSSTRKIVSAHASCLLWRPVNIADDLRHWILLRIPRRSAEVGYPRQVSRTLLIAKRLRDKLARSGEAVGVSEADFCADVWLLDDAVIVPALVYATLQLISPELVTETSS